jgi:hypothetical protein
MGVKFRSRVARPIFVLGAPRSGTTLVGRYLASSPSVLDLDEYRGFFVAYQVVPECFRRVPARFQDRYCHGIADVTRQIAETIARTHRARWYCDHTPLNLLVARQIARDVPTAVFVLMVRHHSGVVQSLARSYRDGYEWAGDSIRTRAEVYRRFYLNVAALPRQRTVAVSYDRLCAAPGETLGDLERRLAAFGFPVRELLRTSLVRSHVTSASDRRATIGVRRGDTVQLRAIRSFDPLRWTPRDQRATQRIVAPAQDLIEQRFPGSLMLPECR